MLPRFHAPDAHTLNTEVILPLEEAHHALRVMRLDAGDEIAIFDGRGHEWRGRIAAATRSGVRVTLVEALTPASEPRIPFTVVQAVLKGDHMDAVVRDVTMMGVARIVPVVTDRTIARVTATALKARERWQRVALSAAKQCRRATLPTIAAPDSLGAALDALAGAAGLRIALAEPAAGSPAEKIQDSAPGSAILAVGPEGGWTPAELERLMSAGFRAATLGRLTLRADAAALVAISVLRATWRDL